MLFCQRPIVSIYKHANGSRFIYSNRFVNLRKEYSKLSNPTVYSLGLNEKQRTDERPNCHSLSIRQRDKTTQVLSGWRSIWPSVHITQHRKLLESLLRMSRKRPSLRKDEDDVDDEYKQSKKTGGDGTGKGKDPNQQSWLAIANLLFTVGFLYYVLTNLGGNIESAFLEMSWTEFQNELLAKGEVKAIKITKDSPGGEDADNRGFMTVQLMPGAVFKGANLKVQFVRVETENVTKLEDRIRAAEAQLGISALDAVPITYSDLRGLRMFVNVLMTILLLMAGVTLLMKTPTAKKIIQIGESGNPFQTFMKPKVIRGDTMSAQHRTTFKEVAGLHEPKIEIMEFVEYLRTPERFKKLGAKIPMGMLLTGPPGCGKTLLAKALASEAGVPFLSVNGSNFVEMIGGLGAARVRNLFKEARQKAPCIIYIDEIDCIGKKRSASGSSGFDEVTHTLNQLLTELDGMTSREGILLLASTNRANVLDNALTRPGRLDRHVLIDYPTLSERKEVFEMYLAKLKLDGTPEQYSERLAQLSPGKSGADIANICNEAALFAARHSKTSVDHLDFELAVEKVTAGVAQATRVVDPRERRVIAFHEAGHALMAWLQEHTDPLLKVSIVARTNATIGFSQYQPNNRFLQSKEQMFEEMCLALGGRVAESLIFNHTSSKAQDDLDKVRQLAYGMIRVLGMSEKVGPLSFEINDENDFGVKPYSKRLKHIIDEEAGRLVADAYKATEKIITENKEKLKEIAEALCKEETLNYKDIEKLIGPPPFGDKKVHIVSWDELHEKHLKDKTSEEIKSAPNEGVENSSEEIKPPPSENVKSSSSEELKN